MRRQKQNGISCWVLGFLAMLLCYAGPVSSEEDSANFVNARFLYQSTFGPTPALIDQVEEVGIESWIKQQLLLPATYHRPLYDTPFSKGAQANRENAWYQIVLTSEDQLRQRMAFALSQILVVSRYGGALSSKPTGLVDYYDVLVKHAFGNYRDLLHEVAIHPAMGNYLSMMGSTKENTSTGALPDENFARELMQLFTLGLYELNLDGSVKRDPKTGKPLPTYSQTDIQELARALTGWKNSDTAFVEPMRVINSRHDTNEKTVLGTTIPAGLTAQEELSQVLDILMSHPNIAPFVSKFLIQRFVSSNPSPEYVARVARVFNNNGKGVKGDLSAVIRAVLLDNEAMGLTNMPPMKVKEPILVLTNFHRAAGFTLTAARYDGATTVMNTAEQGALRSPSVFNFYSPDYQPSNEFVQSGMVSPEYELLDWSVYTDLVNFMLSSTRSGGGDTYTLDFSELYSLLDDHEALVERVDERFFAGTASPELKALLLEVSDEYRTDYVPTTKLALVIFTAISGDEFYIQD
ncbi:DUF1800 domain-containing protein [Vibrio parahaemolyticus]|uniref:DUF1800 domain-containing protein n=1 Tax=Vibrio parahaemolyticus TaxID=670 RepID=UPI001C4FBFC5|nr:DUF1800 domain-containing protein [Vibrio parahaemolyticus]EGQ8294739.1 DUF1800 family protein [Vibrio parahaemolyticus]HCH0956450.1 DUF1800 domain-containing protein [Vibrio parahaemolyticus]